MPSPTAAPRVVLLGFTVPDEVLAEVMASDVRHATQTHTFAWGLVRALRAAGCSVRLLSAVPVSTYPGNGRLHFRPARFRHADVDGRLLGFVNLLGLKHLTRFIAAWRAGGRELREQNVDVLLVHGVNTAFLWAAALLARRGVRVVPVLTDPPGVPLPTDGRLVRTLRRIDVALVRAALGGCAGVVALTGPLADVYAPGRPRLIMEGIFNPPVAVRPHTVAAPATRDIVYAGGLTRSYGVDRLVAAFRALPGEQLRLLLFGRGDLECWLREQAAADPRIALPELIDRDVLVGRLATAAVLVNPRPVDQDFVRYSFPSKLIEYLSAGVPVVTTRLPGIPADYAAHLAYAEPDTVDGLYEAIAGVLALPVKEAAARGAAGQAFVRHTRGTGPQGLRLRAFLETLSRPLPIAPEGDPIAHTSAARQSD
ncbi:glycosyltransferase [Micromonospora sp. CA-259024]|uniref:glycosyltransferase n=1 Tax=Micromonospora sp. CA-259024 TaxID=3239965 RepID=UPI003D8B50E1